MSIRLLIWRIAITASVFIQLRILYILLFKLLSGPLFGLAGMALLARMTAKIISFFTGSEDWLQSPSFELSIVFLGMVGAYVMFHYYTEIYEPIRRNGINSNEFIDFQWNGWFSVIGSEFFRSLFIFLVAPISLYIGLFDEFSSQRYQTVFYTAGMLFLFSWVLNASIRYAYYRGTQDKSDVSVS